MPAVLGYGPYLRGSLVYSSENLSAFFAKRNFEQALDVLNERVKTSTWLAGEEFTAADIMNVFVLTTARLFLPYSLEGYDAIIAYLERATTRETYIRAMEKGDPGFKSVAGATSHASKR